MLLEDASIHDDEDASFARLFGGFFVDYVFLHPDRGNLQTNCLINHFAHELRSPKDVHDMDFLGHIQQRSVSLLPEHLGDLGIDRNDAIAMGLHVRGNPMAGAKRAIGKANHGDGLGAIQQIANGIGLSY